MTAPEVDLRQKLRRDGLPPALRRPIMAARAGNRWIRTTIGRTSRQKEAKYGNGTKAVTTALLQKHNDDSPGPLKGNINETKDNIA